MPTPRRNPKYLAALAGASLAILIVGFSIRPRGGANETLQATAPVDTLRLQRLTQRRSIEGLGEFFNELSGQAAAYVLRLEQADRSAVLWEPDLAATSGGRGSDAPVDALRREPDDALLGRIQVAGPQLPASLYSLEGGARFLPLERVPARLYQPGAWAVAVWRTPSRQPSYASGQFLGIEQIMCGEDTIAAVRTNILLDAAMEGGGLFDIEGGLMGLIVRCDDHFAALDVEAVAELFASEQTIETRLLARHGVRLAPLSEPVQKLLNAQRGLLVTTVWRGYPAHAAGIRPGDVVTGLDGEPVEGLESLEPALLPVSRELLDLNIRRWGRAASVKLAARGVQRSPADVAWSTSDDGLKLESIGPASRIARAGGMPGDRLLQVNQSRPSNPDEASLALAADEASFIVLARGERMWGRLIEP